MCKRYCAAKTGASWLIALSCLPGASDAPACICIAEYALTHRAVETTTCGVNGLIVEPDARCRTHEAFAAMIGRRLSGSMSCDDSSMMTTSKACSASTGSLAELQVTPTTGMLFSSFLRRRSAPCRTQQRSLGSTSSCSNPSPIF